MESLFNSIKIFTSDTATALKVIYSIFKAKIKNYCIFKR
jgi:hypothetical protein